MDFAAYFILESGINRNFLGAIIGVARDHDVGFIAKRVIGVGLDWMSYEIAHFLFALKILKLINGPLIKAAVDNLRTDFA